LGFEAAGGECVFSCEWDKYCSRTYHANFGEKPWGDIKEIDESWVPDHDILLAGFPCQPFSIAGVTKHRALGNEHGFEHVTQGPLFFEIIRVLAEKRPFAFLLENVRNLVRHDRGRTFEVILDTLVKELEYDVKWKIIDAKSVTPQHRERTYIVGFRVPTAFQFPELGPRILQLQSLLERDVDNRYTLTDHLWKYLQDYARKHRSRGNGFGYGLVDLADPEVTTRTLSARYYKDGSEILIPQEGGNPRRLTPRECARLMGFPEDFKIVVSDTRAYKQFGNSVVVPVVEAIAKEIVKWLPPPTGVESRGAVNGQSIMLLREESAEYVGVS
jgi:DNA (cytosine-5)-methyltransferase 1